MLEFGQAASVRAGIECPLPKSNLQASLLVRCTCTGASGPPPEETGAGSSRRAARHQEKTLDCGFSNGVLLRGSGGRFG